MSAMQRPCYCAPKTLPQALALMADPAMPAVVLGGGTIAVAELNHDLLRVARVVDLAGLEETFKIVVAADATTIGASVTYSMLRDPRIHPLLRQVSRGITGGPQIRNQGTIGGSACYASPASDMPTVLVALGTKLTLASLSGGTRVIQAKEFFQGAFLTSRRDDEILISIVVPHQEAKDRWGYHKFKIAESSWPIAVAAAQLTEHRQGMFSVSITIGAATECPVVIPSLRLDSSVSGRITAADQNLIRNAVRQTPANWWEDELADAPYRRRIVETIAIDAVEDALRKE